MIFEVFPPFIDFFCVLLILVLKTKRSKSAMPLNVLITFKSKGKGSEHRVYLASFWGALWSQLIMRHK